MKDQPFTDEEVELIAGFCRLTVEQVRGIAWLTVMKLGLAVVDVDSPDPDCVCDETSTRNCPVHQSLLS